MPRQQKSKQTPLTTPTDTCSLTPRKVVIVGAGFGGLTAAKAMSKAAVEITMVDSRNYHLFQPLLYQVATAGLSPADISWPIRTILRRQQNIRVIMETVTDVDTAERRVYSGELPLEYDYLILASGAEHSYFGHAEWAQHAPGLKTIDDATEVRRRILTAFEQAETAHNAESRGALLTFVVVGAGPTGVELAGAMAELARKSLQRDFRNIDPASARILLIEAGPRVLPTFPRPLADYTRQSLEGLGVEVRCGYPVGDCAEAGVVVSNKLIRAATVIWAAGVKSSPVSQWLDADADTTGRVRVTPDLSVPGFPDVFVIGDACLVHDGEGNPVPGIAPAAKQQGAYVARVIQAKVEGRMSPEPFVYRHQGNLATIGRNAAVIDFGFAKLKGRLAWWIWGVAHIYLLIGVRAPLLVATQWLWSYITYDKGARLITGPPRG